MSAPQQTTYYLSSAHAALFERKIAQAGTRAALESAAAEHAGWLLGRDKDRLRGRYAARLAQVGAR